MRWLEDMKAVVMAGGEGTRLRPLTSNQPKPMVPIVGKPCMEHIIELLRGHGFEDVVITLAFLPQAIRSHFGDGESLGLNIEYSVEELPLGTAGSVRLASEKLDDTFLVISGDALCDVDLGVAASRGTGRRGAAVTIGLKSVDNPLEFGIVVTGDDGRVERFLEKPSWGQVFSDTINTGIYVLEPEVLKHIPTDRPYDFSKELFPLLLEMGRPIYGHVLDGYWQDIGNLDQYRQANFDALDERVRLNIGGVRLRGNVWIGEGADVYDVEEMEGPAFIGNYTRIARDASVGPYSVLSNGVTLRERARTTRTMIDASTHVGRSALIEGAVIGRSCDIRDHVRIHEGAAIGDEVTIGSESSIMPHVRIYPYKEVETGSQLYENLIWETRASPQLFGKDGVTGFVNVDLTPETAARLATALGTALKRGLPRRREPRLGAGVPDDQALDDLGAERGRHRRRRPACLGPRRRATRPEDAGLCGRVHVGSSHLDPEAVFIRFYEPPGILLTPGLQKEIERNFTRQEFRRASATDVGSISYPARVRESYAQDLLDSLDVEAIRERGFRIVVDYGYSAASFVLPLVVGPLGVEAVSAHGFFADDGGTGRQPLAQTIGRTKTLVTSIGADFGAVFDQSGERLFLVDEQGHDVPVDQALLLFVRLLAERGTEGKLAFPVTVTSKVDELAGDKLEIVRTANSLTDLTRARGRGRGRLCRRGRRRLRLSDLPARLRRRREPREAARAARAVADASLGARGRAARAHAPPPPGSPARGRRRGS